MRKALLTAATAMAFLSLSCSTESEKSMLALQEEGIERFVNAQTAALESAYAVSNGGSVRLVLTDGSGDALKSDGTVTFYYAGYVMNGSSISSQSLFATNNPELSASTGIPTDGTPLTVNIAEAGLIEGLRKGLEGVRGGEECFILFSGRYGFGKRQSGTIPANSALAYHVWVESISNN